MHISPTMVLLAAAVSLSGCASLEGGPRSVLTSSTTEIESATSNYRSYVAIKTEYDRKTVPAEAQEFRNRVLMVYMDAIDETYDTYSSQLFSEGIQTGLGFDTAIIGMSTLGALFENSADDMVSAIAAAAGIHAAINKNLYFDRTLPALIATMDTRRIRIETEITAKMALPTSQYPIEAAMRDLRRYHQAGMLYRAITDVTGTAAVQRDQ